MSSLFTFIKNLIFMLFKIKPSKRIKKEARKEVKDEEHRGGMDAVRKSIADSQRREK